MHSVYPVYPVHDRFPEGFPLLPIWYILLPLSVHSSVDRRFHFWAIASWEPGQGLVLYSPPASVSS